MEPCICTYSSLNVNYVCAVNTVFVQISPTPFDKRSRLDFAYTPPLWGALRTKLVQVFLLFYTFFPRKLVFT